MTRGLHLAFLLAAAFTQAVPCQGPMLASPGPLGPIVRSGLSQASSSPAAPALPTVKITRQIGGDDKDDPKEKAKAAAFNKKVVAGRKVNTAVKKVLRLAWHANLKSAVRDARTRKRPILWIQVLGGLKRFT